MWDWLLIAFCFLIMALTIVFLFNKSYSNKLRYYANPMDLAKEVMEQNTKKCTELQI